MENGDRIIKISFPGWGWLVALSMVLMISWISMYAIGWVSGANFMRNQTTIENFFAEGIYPPTVFNGNQSSKKR